MEKEEQYDELLVLAILPKYIGNRYTMLVRKLGYKTLHDLAAGYEMNISSLGGFGEKRMAAIRQALADHGLAFKPLPDPAEVEETMDANIRQTMGKWTNQLNRSLKTSKNPSEPTKH